VILDKNLDFSFDNAYVSWVRQSNSRQESFHCFILVDTESASSRW